MFLNYFFIIVFCHWFLLVTWAKEFKIYWNIPSFACSQRFNLPYLNVTERYGIVQNFDDNFRGEQISIMYDPGLFPAISENGTYRNGGVPQEGNLKIHLEKFERDVDKQIPDKENSGLAIIDFEFWRPVWRQNFGKFQPYKDVSIQLVKEANPLLTMEDVQVEANRLFTEFAKKFMLETIVLGKQLRPNAQWGYYGLPHCFNGRGNVIEDCEQQIQDENDETQWLYDNSDVIFPSIYMPERILPCNRPLMVRGRIKESVRLSSKADRNNKPLVIAYHRYKYPDTLEYMNDTDNINAVETAKESGADGIVLWGAWNDVNTIEKCIEFYDYLESNLGPTFQIATRKPPEVVTEASVETTQHPTTQSSANVQLAGKTNLLGAFILLLIVAAHNR